MTQLIINGTAYPKTSNDKYKCYKTELSEKLRMAAGNMVAEVRGTYTVIEYSYDYFPNDLLSTCLSDLRSGKELTVSYLPPAGTDLVTQTMRCTTLPAPTFAFGRGDKSFWHNVAFKLEAVDVD